MISLFSILNQDNVPSTNICFYNYVPTFRAIFKHSSHGVFNPLPACCISLMSECLSHLELYTCFLLNSHKEQLLNIELNSDQMSHGIFLCVLRAALRVRLVETAE